MNEQNKRLVVIDWCNSGTMVYYMYGTPEQIFANLEENHDFNPERDTAHVFELNEISTID